MFHSFELKKKSFFVNLYCRINLICANSQFGYLVCPNIAIVVRLHHVTMSPCQPSCQLGPTPNAVRTNLFDRFLFAYLTMELICFYQQEKALPNILQTGNNLFQQTPAEPPPHRPTWLPRLSARQRPQGSWPGGTSVWYAEIVPTKKLFQATENLVHFVCTFP